MKFVISKPVDFEVVAIRIQIPLRYDGEDGAMPQDFPLRKGPEWDATVELHNGAIRNWPSDKTGKFEVYEKVCDCGTYTLLAADDSEVAKISQDYVPGTVPGEYGDYVILEIENGIITNWPKHPDLTDFKQEAA